MAREAYTKTVWVDKSTAVNATNLNHIEEGLKQVDTEAIDLSARVTNLEASGASGEEPTQDLTNLIADVAQLKTDIGNKAATDHTHTEFTQYNAYEARIKTIEDLDLVAALKSITDRLTALELAMETHTHETLAGTTSVGE